MQSTVRFLSVKESGGVSTQVRETNCFLHPAKEGIHSNLNLITDKGSVYSFTLDDVESGDPDPKVVIEPSDPSSLAAADSHAFLGRLRLRLGVGSWHSFRSWLTSVVDTPADVRCSFALKGAASV